MLRSDFYKEYRKRSPEERREILFHAKGIGNITWREAYSIMHQCEIVQRQINLL